MKTNTVSRHLSKNTILEQIFQSTQQCPGLTCGVNKVKPRFLYKTVDLWSYSMSIDRYIHSN